MILTCFCAMHLCFAYAQKIDKIINLSETKFEILKSSTEVFDDTNKSPSFLYLKVELPRNVKDIFCKLSKATIIQLLRDSVTDWSTNLLLYEKYKKDAYLFSEIIHTRRDWLPIKEKEIAYWKQTLK